MTDVAEVSDKVSFKLTGRFYEGQRVKVKRSAKRKFSNGTVVRIEDRSAQPLVGYVCYVKFDDRKHALEAWHHSWLEAL